MGTPNNKNSAAVIAVDIGTSGCRADLLNCRGEVLTSAAQTYTYQCTPENGFAEQDPEQVLEAFIAVVQNAASGYSGRISFIVIDSVMHSLVLVDNAGIPLTPLSIWADTRATIQCSTSSTVHHQHAWHRKTGCPLSPSYPLSRLQWYRDNQQSIFSRLHKAVSIKSYILFRIFGLWIEDHSVASATGLFNLHERRWDDEIVQHLQISTEHLPAPVPVEYRIPAAYSSFGRNANLPEEATWVIGGGDGPMAHLGTAGYNNDHASLTIGTSSAVRVLSSREHAGKNVDAWTYLLDNCHAVSGIASNNGGNVLEYYVRSLLKMNDDWTVLDAGLTECRPDRKLFCFPYLFKERTATAPLGLSGFLGVKPSHSQIDLLRATVEGIIFHVLLMFEKLTCNLKIHALALSGSMTQLVAVQKMITELLDVSVYRMPGLLAPQRGSVSLIPGIEGKGQRMFSRKTCPSGLLDKYNDWCNLRTLHQS